MSVTPGDVVSTLRRFRIHISPQQFVLDLDRSEGSYLVDAVTGRRFLDLSTFYAALPLGAKHPLFSTPEFEEAMVRVGRFRVANSDVYTQQFAEFVQTFAENVLPEAFDGLFFIDGGALAVENALKAAFDWKVHRNLLQGLGERGHEVIHFRQAFHGRSGYTLSLTNTHDPRKYQYYPRFDWPRIVNPMQHFPETAASLAQTQQLEHDALGQIRAILEARAADVAAIIIEPIQGEGGDNHFRKEFLQGLRNLADEHGVLLIFDEVQTGMGLTGSWWCFEQLGVVPDLLVFGKKSQVCGFASTRRIDQSAENVFTVPSRISSTFGGNLSDMVRATFIIRAICEENLLSNVRHVGKFLLDELRRLAAGAGVISNVRGRGLMMAFDLPDTVQRDALSRKILEHGALILPCGQRSLRLRPQLGFSVDDAKVALEILTTAVDEICY